MSYSDELIRQAALSRFGIPVLRDHQIRAIRSVLSGRDTLAVLPTGSGKSLCFQLPAFLLPGLTLVVTPLVSLMKDQTDGLTARGLDGADHLSSARSDSENKSVQDRLTSLKILYVTPERLESGAFRSALSRSGATVSQIVTDESHCVSLWGQSFRPAYLRVRDFAEIHPKAVRSAFTATATAELEKDISRRLGLRNPDCVRISLRRENLSINIRYVRDKTRYLLETVDPAASSIIFTSSRVFCERLADFLRGRGVSAAAYHAGLPAEDRKKVQEDFLADRTKCLAATSAFGMGIDKPDIRTIWHYDLPIEPEEYYQEIGRAGRGLSHAVTEALVRFEDFGEAETLFRYHYPEWPEVKRLARTGELFGDQADDERGQKIRETLGISSSRELRSRRRDYLAKRAIQKKRAAWMRAFAGQARCRSARILEYFGEKTGDCGKCDVCRARAGGAYAGLSDASCRVLAALTLGKRSWKELRETLAGLSGRHVLQGGFASLKGVSYQELLGIVYDLAGRSLVEISPDGKTLSAAVRMRSGTRF